VKRRCFCALELLVVPLPPEIESRSPAPSHNSSAEIHRIQSETGTGARPAATTGRLVGLLLHSVSAQQKRFLQIENLLRIGHWRKSNSPERMTAVRTTATTSSLLEGHCGVHAHSQDRRDHFPSWQKWLPWIVSVERDGRTDIDIAHSKIDDIKTFLSFLLAVVIRIRGTKNQSEEDLRQSFEVQ
jgi:hypothetical protein